MSTELVTAHAGKSHVESADIGALYAGAFGSGRYALDVGEGLAVSMTDSNTLHIGTGGFIFDGRWVRVTGTGEDVKIANGTQASYRKDLVVYTYTRDPSSSNIESGAWSVVQGTAASSESGAVVPEITEGSILDGDLTASVAVAEVDLAGLTPTAKLLLPCVSSLSGLRDSVSQFENVSPSSHRGFYVHCYATVAGVSVGYNVNPSQTLAKGATVATFTTEKAFTNTDTILLRGTHAGHQSGMHATFGSDGHTITLTTEQADTFAVGDTGSFLIPCVWAL